MQYKTRMSHSKNGLDPTTKWLAMMRNNILRIESRVDAVLLHLLGAVCLQRDHIDVAANERNEKPFNDVFGALARKTLRSAINDDPAWSDHGELRRYGLHSRWDHLHQIDVIVEDHVIPLHAWKTPLQKRAVDENWQVDEDGQKKIRRFVLDYYVTAQIPKSLHRVLARSTMPKDWQIDFNNPHANWARYVAKNVTNHLGKELKFPGFNDDSDSDFISLP